MKTAILAILLIALVLLLTACGKVVPQDDPASQHCLSLGGELEYVEAGAASEEDEDGVFGICHLPGGVDCELWNLFTGTCEELDDRYYCTPHDREFEACIDQYMPVCAHKSNGDMFGTFNNLCEACIGDDVSYILPGECLV